MAFGICAVLFFIFTIACFCIVPLSIDTDTDMACRGICGFFIFLILFIASGLSFLLDRQQSDPPAPTTRTIVDVLDKAEQLDEHRTKLHFRDGTEWVVYGNEPWTIGREVSTTCEYCKCTDRWILKDIHPVSDNSHPIVLPKKKSPKILPMKDDDDDSIF